MGAERLCRGLAAFLGCCSCRMLRMGALGGCMVDRVCPKLPGHAIDGSIHQVFPLLRGCRI